MQRASLTVLAATTGLGILGLAVPAASGRVVLSEEFTNATRSAATGTDIYNTNSAVTWYTYSPAVSSVDVSAAVGNPAKGIVFTDASNTLAGRMELNLSPLGAFNTAQAADATITFGVDMRVDAFKTGAAQSHFRFVMKDGGRANPYFAVGFTRATIGGQDRLFFFGGDTNSAANNYFTPGAADAIGWNSATSSWASGFDLGTYSTATVADNDSNDQFYRLEVTFKPAPAQGPQVIDVKATQLSSGLSATLSRTVATPYVFSNVSSDFITLNAPGSGEGTVYFDNITVSVVPEPAALGVLGLAGLGLVRRR